MSWQFEFTPELLAQCVKRNKNPAQLFQALEAVLPRYEINTPLRVAAFLAQCGHESADFTILKENLNYSAQGLNKIFPKYFIKAGRDAEPYNRQPEKIANVVYASRMGNGDEASGDGWTFRGRGAIQLTGRTNYTKFAESIGYTIEEAIAYLDTLQGAIESAAWFWWTNRLNDIADRQDLVTMTKRINGGTIGLQDRQQHYQHNLDILSGGYGTAHEHEDPSWPTLRRGSEYHDWVKSMQTQLGINADGDFGRGTEAALIEWQEANDMEPSGVATPDVLKKLLGYA